jgi:hypothetical protein
VSDYNPFLDEGGSDDGGPAEGGGATGDGQTTDQQTFDETPRAYLDVDSAGDHYVRVRVDGEDLEVPLKEALQGYSRTADYTRKTQTLAQERQAAEYALTLQRALQAQPEETIGLLARQFNVPLGQSPPPYAGAPSYDDGYDEYDDDEYDDDPTDRRLSEQQEVIDHLLYRDQRREADQVLQRAIGGIQRKYNLDQATINQIVSTALQSRAGPEQFEYIYKGIAFDRAQAARAQAQAQRADGDNRRRAAGQQASQLVGNGSSAASVGGAMNPTPSDGHMSVGEAFDAALSDLGMQL